MGSGEKDSSVQEITAMLGYLIKHNRDHAAEILELAERARSLGHEAVYRDIARGVDLLEESNASLQAALAALEA